MLMAWKDTNIEGRKKTIVVNLFGGPGAGKSTTAALIFGLLKSAGIDAEQVTEYAKDKTWEGSQQVLANQPYVLGKQLHRLWRVDGKVQVAITDSPILLSGVYNKKHKVEFDALAVKLFGDFDNVNYRVIRSKPYNPNGRNQTEPEAKEKDVEVIEFLDKFKLISAEVPGTPDGACRIAEQVYNQVTGKTMKATITIELEE